MKLKEVKFEGEVKVLVYEAAPIKKALTVRNKVPTSYTRKEIARIQTLPEGGTNEKID